MAGKRDQKRSVMDRVAICGFPTNSASVFNFRMTTNVYVTCNTLYSEASCAEVNVRRNLLLTFTVE